MDHLRGAQEKMEEEAAKRGAPRPKELHQPIVYTRKFLNLLQGKKPKEPK